MEHQAVSHRAGGYFLVRPLLLFDSRHVQTDRRRCFRYSRLCLRPYYSTGDPDGLPHPRSAAKRYAV